MQSYRILDRLHASVTGSTGYVSRRSSRLMLPHFATGTARRVALAKDETCVQLEPKQIVPRPAVQGRRVQAEWSTKRNLSMI